MNVWQIDYKEPLKEEFFEVARHIYLDDPHWLSECKGTTNWQFSDSNPYLNQITTKIWGVEHDARVSGFFNPSLRIDGEPAAFFGFFESINNPEKCLEKSPQTYLIPAYFTSTLFSAYGRFAETDSRSC